MDKQPVNQPKICKHCFQPIFDNGTVYVHRRFIGWFNGQHTTLEDQWCDEKRTHMAESMGNLDAESKEVRRMLKEGDKEGLAAYANQGNRERAKQAVARIKAVSQPPVEGAFTFYWNTTGEIQALLADIPNGPQLANVLKFAEAYASHQQAAEREQIERLTRERDMHFMVTGVPVVMATDFSSMKERAESSENKLCEVVGKLHTAEAETQRLTRERDAAKAAYNLNLEELAHDRELISAAESRVQSLTAQLERYREALATIYHVTNEKDVSELAESALKES